MAHRRRSAGGPPVGAGAILEHSVRGKMYIFILEALLDNFDLLSREEGEAKLL